MPDPHEAGHLDVGDGQQVYFEVAGNPAGVPVVVLHGGPGSGWSPSARHAFDPTRYRIICFDQWGCGRSQPRVGPTTDLRSNTTWHLVHDMERLREPLGVTRWVLRGASWGATLGLAYAITHPVRVLAMLFTSVALSRSSDIRWLYHEVGRYYPVAWERFVSFLPEEHQGDQVVGYYSVLHLQPDPELRERAAIEWCRREDTIAPVPGSLPNPRYEDPLFRMTFARVVTHHFRRFVWLEPTAPQGGRGAVRDTSRPRPRPLRPRKSRGRSLGPGRGPPLRRALGRRHQPRRWGCDDSRGAPSGRAVRPAALRRLLQALDQEKSVIPPGQRGRLNVRSVPEPSRAVAGDS